MGKRATTTTKGGKYMNPTDQARKESRKRELKKNKKQRQMVRSAVLKVIFIFTCWLLYRRNYFFGYFRRVKIRVTLSKSWKKSTTWSTMCMPRRLSIRRFSGKRGGNWQKPGRELSKCMRRICRNSGRNSGNSGPTIRYY